VVETSAWSVPPLFELIAHTGHVDREELYRTLNMGIGMVIVLSPQDAEETRRFLPESLTICFIREGEGVVIDFS
jgi:phosphoribosylformylglycinamidine cyclo-ligase